MTEPTIIYETPQPPASPPHPLRAANSTALVNLQTYHPPSRAERAVKWAARFGKYALAIWIGWQLFPVIVLGVAWWVHR